MCQNKLMNDYKSVDKDFLNNAKEFVEKVKTQRKHFFGYPGNLSEDSKLVNELRVLETELFYMNNAGDPYERGDNSFDGKEYEQKLLDLFYKRYQMNPDTSWGYITTGGSESNWWAIKTGFTQYPNGHLIFSKAAHYSVLKSITIGDKALLDYSINDTGETQSKNIDGDKCISKINEIIIKKEVPILLLTWGTTRLGSCDDIKGITDFLIEHNLPYYCHVDAAYYGGLPSNQIDAPVLQSLDEVHADSISISFHKLFGVPNINSVVLAKNKTHGSYIDYIGHHDTTISGSRTFSIFSATQRIKEVYERSDVDWFIKNIKLFETLLIKNKIPFYRDEKSSIFVISKPSQSFCEKYHLSSFNGKTQKDSCTHIIMNPFHTSDEITDLFNDLKKEKLTEVDL